jgi:hypothetical protein
MKKYLAVLSIIILHSSITAQIEPKHTFTMEVGMPIPMSNFAYRKMMKGIVAVSPFYQYRFKNSFAIGAGINYSYLQINKFTVPSSQPVTGGVHSAGVFVKASVEKFHNEQFATDFGVKIGYNNTYFVTDYNDSILGSAQSVGNVSITPMLGLILSVDEFTSYRFTLGYNMQGYGFYPRRLGLTTENGFDTSLYSRQTSFLIVGFGFTHYFKSKEG